MARLYGCGVMLKHSVLILVLMEYALWLSQGVVDALNEFVLILVLMEYALWLWNIQWFRSLLGCLNPCSNGICSLIGWESVSIQSGRGVLILVLMEYALWFNKILTEEFWNFVLILVLMEYALWYNGGRVQAFKIEVLILVLMEYALWWDKIHFSWSK